MLKWSDCTRLQMTTDGNYNKVYSCVYADDNPNRAVRILFRSEAEAENFERVILRPSLDAIYEWWVYTQLTIATIEPFQD